MDYHWLEQTHKAIFGSGLTYSGIGAPERYIHILRTSIHTSIHPYIHIHTPYTYNRQIESDATEYSTTLYWYISVYICTLYMYLYICMCMYKHYRQLNIISGWSMDVSDPEQLSVHYLNYSIDPPNQSNHRLPEKFLFFFHPSSSSSSFHFFVSFSFLLHPLSSSLSPLPLFSHIILITRTSPQPWRLLQTVLPDLHFFPGSRNKQIDTCFFLLC